MHHLFKVAGFFVSHFDISLFLVLLTNLDGSKTPFPRAHVKHPEQQHQLLCFDDKPKQAMEGAQEAPGLDDLVASLRESGSDDPTMKLTRAEKARALEIREACDADDRIKSTISDFEIAQYAVTAEPGETMESICQRIFLLQCFKEEYGITDDEVEGIELFIELTKLQPGVYLSVEYVKSSENHILIMDYAMFFPASLKSSDHQMRVYLASHYYIFNCLNPEFRSMRNGISLLTECMDSSLQVRLWRKLLC